MSTDARRISRAWFAAPAAAVVAAIALAGPAGAASPGPVSATPYVPTAGAGAQGLIMKDGNICDPIRHIGC
jgi:hypothetical protein